MCYDHYRAEGASAWEEFLEAVLFDDYDVDSDGSHWACHSLSALGGSLSLGYQWELKDTHGSIGLHRHHFQSATRAADVRLLAQVGPGGPTPGTHASDRISIKPPA
jgi:hypothetical protein